MALNDKGIDGGVQFPETSWSVIRGARDPNSTEHEQQLGRLVQLYWQPVYWVIRHSWKTSSDEARDLTQEFFAARIFDKGLVAQWVPQRGSFRALLKAAVLNFLRQTARDAHRLRRGGHAPVVSLDDEALALAEQLPSEGQTPEEIFDEAWNHLVLERALALLDRTLAEAGHELARRAFQRYELEGGRQSLSYAALAEELGSTTSQVKHALLTARATFREVAYGIARQYADDPETLAAELRVLTGD